MALIRDALDDNTAFPKCTPHSVVEVLSSFLAALSKPLLPPELYPTVRCFFWTSTCTCTCTCTYTAKSASIILIRTLFFLRLFFFEFLGPSSGREDILHLSQQSSFNQFVLSLSISLFNGFNWTFLLLHLLLTLCPALDCWVRILFSSTWSNRSTLPSAPFINPNINSYGFPSLISVLI